MCVEAVLPVWCHEQHVDLELLDDDSEDSDPDTLDWSRFQSDEEEWDEIQRAIADEIQEHDAPESSWQPAWREDEEWQTRTANWHICGSAAVCDGEEPVTVTEQRLRWFLRIIDAAMRNPLPKVALQLIGLLQRVCLTQIGQQRMTFRRGTSHFDTQNWLAVLLAVVQDAEAALAKQFADVEGMRLPPNDIVPQSLVSQLLEEIRKECWVMKFTPWLQTHDTTPDADEQQQAKILNDILNRLRWSGLFETGAMADLIALLWRVSWDIVDPGWREEDLRGT